MDNDPAGSRTRDLRIKSPLLYQLSYRVVLRAIWRTRITFSTPTFISAAEWRSLDASRSPPNFRS